MRIPISAASLNVQFTGTTGTNAFVFTNSSTGQLANLGGVEGTTAVVFQVQQLSNNTLLGVGNQPLANLMKSFTKYRLRDIVITMEPLLPTSASGSTCVAFIPDAGCLSSSSTAATYGKAATARISARGPIWSPIVLRVPNSSLDPELKQVDIDNAASATDSLYRQMAYGSITVGYSGFSAPAAAQTIHVVSFTANLELFDLVDESLF